MAITWGDSRVDPLQIGTWVGPGDYEELLGIMRTDAPTGRYGRHVDIDYAFIEIYRTSDGRLWYQHRFDHGDCPCGDWQGHADGAYEITWVSLIEIYRIVEDMDDAPAVAPEFCAWVTALLS